MRGGVWHQACMWALAWHAPISERRTVVTGDPPIVDDHVVRGPVVRRHERWHTRVDAVASSAARATDDARTSNQHQGYQHRSVGTTQRTSTTAKVLRPHDQLHSANETLLLALLALGKGPVWSERVELCMAGGLSIPLRSCCLPTRHTGAPEEPC